MSNRVAIVGGGYIGAELAKALEAKAEVTLIEPRSHFVHAPAMIRAVVQPSLLDRALIPYNSLLTRGQIVAGRATSVDEGGVTLADGGRIEADQIVVATGSGNSLPFKPQGDDIAGLRAENASVNDLLTKADSVAIVGAGAVGIELAGEIAHYMLGKSVTLISAHAQLFPEKPSRLGSELARKLQAAGVTIVYGARAENLEAQSAPYSGVLHLSNGTEIAADLIFPTIGARATSDLLKALPGAEDSSANRVRVDGWLRPSTLPNVFAAGDVADAGDAMTIVAASRQLPWLKKNLTAVLDGRKVTDLKPYTPWKNAPILVPLGPDKGNSYLSLFTAGNFLTRQIKGKDLFLGKYNKLLGRG